MKNKYLFLLVSFLVKHKDNLTLSQSCRTLFMHPFNFWKFPETKSEVSDLRTLLLFVFTSQFFSFMHSHVNIIYQGRNGNVCGGFSDQPWRNDIPRGKYMPSERWVSCLKICWKLFYLWNVLPFNILYINVFFYLNSTHKYDQRF